MSASGKEATATTSPATSSSKKKLGETRKQRKKRQAEEAEAKAAADSEEKASGAAERVDAGGETDVEEVERELGGRERVSLECIQFRRLEADAAFALLVRARAHSRRPDASRRAQSRLCSFRRRRRRLLLFIFLTERRESS